MEKVWKLEQIYGCILLNQLEVCFIVLKDIFTAKLEKKVRGPTISESERAKSTVPFQIVFIVKKYQSNNHWLFKRFFLYK